MSIFKCRADHPYRLVNWRWERARILNEYGKTSPGQSTDDKWIKIAAKFRKSKDNCRDEIELYNLFDRYPEIAMAYELWDEEAVNSFGRANPMRHEIEARLLSQEPFESIAQKSNLPVNVIKWY